MPMRADAIAHQSSLIRRGRLHVILFFFKQKTAYEMRISDWSSDVCSSDLSRYRRSGSLSRGNRQEMSFDRPLLAPVNIGRGAHRRLVGRGADREFGVARLRLVPRQIGFRSEEPQSDLQSLISISFAIFRLHQQ